MKSISILKSVCFAAGLAAFGLPAMAADAVGVWTAAEGKSRIKISKCGANLCGNVVWLKEPNDESGKPKLDARNENTGLRSRPIIGVPILLAMVPEGEAFRGKIYNAEDGKTYSATLKLLSENSVQVQGCVAAIFCKTQVWSRN